MSTKTGIEWTNATWNPVTGCTKVSQGCKHCYAERDWPRFAANSNTIYFGRQFTDIQCHPQRLEDPLRWTRPRLIFVNSMSDLFHEVVPFPFLDQVFAVMALAHWHTFQIATKRPERMLEYLTQHAPGGRYIWEAGQNIRMPRGQEKPGPDWPLPNVWLGVSIEDQTTADERIPILLKTPAALRWVSAEPLLGPIDLSGEYLAARCGGRYPFPNLPREHRSQFIHLLDWVVVGGESGPKARPMRPEWARELRDQCAGANVPFFFKQWGALLPDTQAHELARIKPIQIASASAVGVDLYYRPGKAISGARLDDLEHKNWPKEGE